VTSSQRALLVNWGYTIGARHFDALIFGYWEGGRLIYAAQTRSGFTPAVREQLHQRFRGLEVSECPFANLPERRASRWGEGLTAAKMKDIVAEAGSRGAV
jgi:ATP-dependent DNA ligase